MAATHVHEHRLRQWQRRSIALQWPQIRQQCPRSRCMLRNICVPTDADVDAAGEAGGAVLTALGWGFDTSTPGGMSRGGAAGGGMAAGLPQVSSRHGLILTRVLLLN